MTTPAYITPINASDHTVTHLSDVPTELVAAAPSIWYQTNDDGTLSTYLVTKKDHRKADQATTLELWQIDARQGDAIDDIGEIKYQPESVDNTAFNRDGYSIDDELYLFGPRDGSNFYQSLDYLQSYSADDVI